MTFTAQVIVQSLNVFIVRYVNYHTESEYVGGYFPFISNFFLCSYCCQVGLHSRSFQVHVECVKLIGTVQRRQ